MNIKDYISSGVLEAYLLGAASAEEAREVEQLAARHPEIREELSRIEEVLEKLAEKGAIPPPASVQEGLFRQPGLAPQSPAQPQGQRQSLPGFARYAVAASVVFTLISSSLAFVYRQRWMEAEQRIVRLFEDNRQMAMDFQQASIDNQKLRTDFQIIASSNYRAVPLKGLAPSPDAKAIIFWSAGSGYVYLRVEQLPAVGADQQYQLWAIVDGKPVDAGVFDVDTDGLLRMKTVTGATAFAVTLEPRGGSTSPTLSAMFLKSS